MAREGIPESYHLGKDLGRRGRKSCDYPGEEHLPKREKNKYKFSGNMPAILRQNILCVDEKDQSEGQMDAAGEKELLENHLRVSKGNLVQKSRG